MIVRLLLSMAFLAWSGSVCAIPAPAEHAAVTRLDGMELSATRVDAVVNRWMQEAHVTGVGIAVLNGGKVVYLEAYGTRDVARRLPLTPDSIMPNWRRYMLGKALRLYFKPGSRFAYSGEGRPRLEPFPDALRHGLLQRRP